VHGWALTHQAPKLIGIRSMSVPATTNSPQGARDDRRDRALLQQVASGNTRALETLYLDYHQRLLQFLSRLCGQREARDEAINDTFWIIWQKAGEFRGASRVSTWIMGIAWRCTLKALRRNADPPPPALADLTAPDPATTGFALEELSEWIAQGLDTLPVEQRATMELAYFLGHSCEEIATIMGCPVNTVKARMFQARIKLRNRLPALGGLGAP
jgi:RNA polymerase sigma-70 factor (ECF subfamily)